MADIFISHSGKDNAVAAAIGERVRRDRPTWSLFYDKDNIRGGQRWQERLREELTSCRVVLALLSRNWLCSPWCFTEAVTATFRGKDFIGIEIEDLTGKDLERGPPILSERQRVRLRNDDNRAWREILEALDRSGLDPDDWYPIPPQVGPYPGLVAFDEKDAGVFFGRKQEITEYLGILDTLRGPDRSQVLVISGASGSGKSSLLRAGLIPRLRRKPEWVVVSPFEVAREPVRNLLDRLGEALACLGIPAQGLDLTKPLDDPDTLAQILDATLRKLEQAAGTWVLLPLDQAEALLARDRQEDDPARFVLAALAQILGRRTRHTVVAATIRTEFEPRLEAAFAGSEIRLRQAPLSAIASLAEIIEKPADRFGIELEQGLSKQIIEDVHSADALPLLAYTLKELHDRGDADRRLTLDEYRVLGGVQGAIAAKLESVLSDPEPTTEEAVALRRAFTRYLIRVDEGAVEGERLLRRVVPRPSLPQPADRVVGRLVDAGLLITKNGTIELAHERLIDDWPKLPLKTWLAHDAADRRLIDQLRQRVNDDTLPDGLLAQAEELLERDHQLSAEEPALAELVQRSRGQKRARERRRRFLVGIALCAALGFAMLASFAFVKRNEAEGQRLAAEAQGLGYSALLQAEAGRSLEGLLDAIGGGRILEGLVGKERALWEYPVTGPLIALQTIIDNIYEKNRLQGDAAVAQVATWKTVTQCIVRLEDGTSQPLADMLEEQLRALMGHNSEIGRRILAKGCTPDGRHIVTTGVDGTVRSRSNVENAPPRLIGLHGGATKLVFRADSKGFATIGVWNDVVWWDLPEDNVAQHTVSLEGLDSDVVSAAFSPSGDQFATGDTKGTVRLWSLSGEPIGGPMRFEDGEITGITYTTVVGLHFAGNGKRIIAVSWNGGVRVWTPLSTSVERGTLPWTSVISVAFSPNDQLFAVAAAGGSVGIWDPGRAQQVPLQAGHTGWVYDLSFSPDGKTLATAGADDTVRLWDVRGHSLAPPIAAGQGQVMGVRFSPKGDRIASAGGDGTVKLWDLSGHLLGQFVGHQNKVLMITFSRDGNFVATSGIDGAVRLWLSSGAPIATFVGRRGALSGEALGADFGAPAVTFSPDGRWLLVPANDRRVVLWRIQSLDELIKESCSWLGVYLDTHPSAPAVCQ
jgi:WD40 repeat protein